MNKMARVFESSLTEYAACTPEMSKIGHRNDKLLRRLAARSMVGLIRFQPDAAHALYNSWQLQPRYERIGGGNDQIVLARDRTVMKIDRESLRMEDRQRVERADSRQQQFEKAGEHIGPSLLPQKVEADYVVPFKHPETVVVTLQPRVELVVPDIADIEDEELQEALGQHEIPPAIIGQQLR